jgi:hypothetical protein
MLFGYQAADAVTTPFATLIACWTNFCPIRARPEGARISDRWLGLRRNADRRAEAVLEATRSSLSGHSPQLRAPCRKDWLSVRKEALVSSCDAEQRRA